MHYADHPGTRRTTFPSAVVHYKTIKFMAVNATLSPLSRFSRERSAQKAECSWSRRRTPHGPRGPTTGARDPHSRRRSDDHGSNPVYPAR
jgi:hypothetical protein